MVFIPDEKVKGKMLKDGNVLKFMYNVAGVGKGLAAAGATLIFAGGLLAGMLVRVLGPYHAILAGCIGFVPGLLLVIGGTKLQKHRTDGWLKAYTKHTGLPEDEILCAAEEFKQPGTVLFSFTKGKDTNSLQKMGFITEHYIKFPGVLPSLVRICDVAACFYTDRFLCGDGGYNKAFVAYSIDRNMACLDIGVSPKAAMEAVEAITERNPLTIKARHFSYGDKEYDAATDMDEVTGIYREVFARYHR